MSGEPARPEPERFSFLDDEDRERVAFLDDEGRERVAKRRGGRGAHRAGPPVAVRGGGNQAFCSAPVIRASTLCGA